MNARRSEEKTDDATSSQKSKNKMWPEVEYRIAAVEAIRETEKRRILSNLRLLRSSLTEKHLQTNAVEFFRDNFPNLSVIRNEIELELELDWMHSDDKFANLNPSMGTPTAVLVDDNPSNGSPIATLVDSKSSKGTPTAALLDENPLKRTPAVALVDNNSSKGSSRAALVDKNSSKGTPAAALVDSNPSKGTPAAVLVDKSLLKGTPTAPGKALSQLKSSKTKREAGVDDFKGSNSATAKKVKTRNGGKTSAVINEPDSITETSMPSYGSSSSKAVAPPSAKPVTEEEVRAALQQMAPVPCREIVAIFIARLRSQEDLTSFSEILKQLCTYQKTNGLNYLVLRNK